MKVLKGGAERGYASLHFSGTGTLLASVSTSPDYMLTVWNWEEEKMGLHSKAFGQDVFKVRFSVDDERRLTTSGTGHIRFWKMAATFTGLKLQGHIGKFGKVELSDIAAFVELPDGKVVSGTETGAMLLWEGNFIKCRFTQVDGVLCHAGEITYIELDRQDRCIITASVDGYIRWWDMFAIDTAEVDSDNSIDFEITPLAEYYIGPGRGIRDLVDSGKVLDERFYVFLDTTGTLSLLRFPVLETMGVSAQIEIHSLSKNHAGAVTGIDTCPYLHLAATCGVDGTVRCWNYIDKKFFGMSSFSCAATVLKWTPLTVDRTGLMSTVGFADGCVRVLAFTGSPKDDGLDAFTLAMVFKPHSAAITDLCFSGNGLMLATAGKDGTIFFFRCDVMSEQNTWLPLRFMKLRSSSAEGSSSKATVVCEQITWNDEGDHVLCTCSDGILREIDLSELKDNSSTKRRDSVESYCFDFPVKEINLKTTASGIPKPVTAGSSDTSPGREDMDDGDGHNGDGNAAAVEEAPQILAAKIIQSTYSLDALKGSSDYVVSALGGPTVQLLECGMDSDIPRRELKVGIHSIDGKDLSKAPLITSIRYGSSRRFLVMGTAYGTSMIRPVNAIETFLTVVASSSSSGGVSAACVSFDDNFLLTAGRDGSIAVHRINPVKISNTSDIIADELRKGLYGIEGGRRVSLNAYEPSYLSLIDSESILTGFNAIANTAALPPGDYLPMIQPATDISPTAYTIEDAKLKLEEDGKKQTAEGKKEKVRSVIKALQREYEHLVQMNSRLPKPVQLSHEAMMVDGEYVATLKKFGEERIAEVHKECAYEAERAQKLREKLMSRLMDSIMVEEIPLRGFRAKRPIVVHSLRTRGMDSSLKEVADMVHAIVRHDMMADARSRSNVSKSMSRAVTQGEDGAGGNNADGTDDEAKNTERRGGSAAARRELRRLRKAKIESHLSLKPNEDEDDARDIKALRLAESTLGSYKLKCADDYEVPEDHRVNAEKKRRQMVLLEESMINMRLRFNERFLALRQMKKKMIETILKDNARVKEIDFELQQQQPSQVESGVLFNPTLDPEEFPDDRDEITDKELTEFKEKRCTTPWALTQCPMNSIITGIKIFLF